jgi:hypothetical protein
MASNPPILNTDPAPPLTSQQPDSQRGYVVCEFCQCQLTRHGEIIKMSEISRDFRDRKEKDSKRIAELEADNTRLQAESEAKSREIETLRGPAAPTDSVGQKQKFL